MSLRRAANAAAASAAAANATAASATAGTAEQSYTTASLLQQLFCLGCMQSAAAIAEGIHDFSVGELLLLLQVLLLLLS